MSELTRTIGVIIGGYGLDDGKSGGTAFCYGDVPAGASSHDWVSALTSAPQSVGIDINPITGGFSASSFDFELAFTETVRELFLHQQRTTSFSVAIDRSAAANQIIILDPDENEVTTLGDSVIWTGDECLLLGAFNAGISIGAFDGGYGATRGYFSTSATAHLAGALVYDEAPQSIRFREVTLVLYDHELETESILWRGFVDDLETGDDGATLRVRTIELYSVLENATVNRGAANYRNHFSFGGLTGGRVTFYGTLNQKTSVFKTGESTPDVALQFGAEHAFRFDYSPAFPHACGGAQIPTSWGLSFDELERGIFSDEVRELFVVDFQSDAARVDADTGLAAASMATSGFSATRELERPFHPLAIMLGFFLSTRRTTASQEDYDVWGPNWSLQMPRNFIDVAGIEALIERFPTFRCERLILGWDGEPENLWEVIQDNLLKPFGFYLGKNTSGQINVGHLPVTLDIGDFFGAGNVEPIPGSLRWQASKQDAVDEVVGVFGETPWSPGNTVTIRGPKTANRNSVRARLMAESSVITYKMPFGQAAQNNSAGDDVIGGGRAYAFLEARATSGAYAIPRIILRFRDEDLEGADYSIGTILAPTELDLEDAWIVDSTGASVRIDAAASTALAGPIIGRELEVETMTYRITLYLQSAVTGALALWRAPSAVVDTGSTTSVINVEQNAFHSSADDTSYFTPGDRIQVVDSTGAQLSFGGELSALTPTTITVDPLDSAPSAGDVVRLYPYSGYANSDVIAGGPDNVYVFMSNDGTTLGAGDDPQRYG